ncbi:MAG: hypothetical protein E6K27_14770 [Gammaproteobacteria bacterium]|nr:MAG: hypothetical protein E6K27_14770 [Gammaproteobacteria bacterium]
MLHKTPPQCLTARQQTVMGVRERKQRQEGEGLSATVAATAPDLDPIMVFIVRCLRRCPWPMIESRSQAGHRRKMISALPPAESLLVSQQSLKKTYTVSGPHP